MARNDVWSSPLKFWGDVIRKAPNKARAFNNYAVALAESGSVEQALEYYKKSSDCDPFYAEPLINLGSHFQVKGDDAMALHYYGKALDMRHEPHPECYNNVGLIQYRNKNLEKAKSCFKTAIALRGHYGKAHYNLAKVCYDLGDIQEAFSEAGNALYGDFTMPHVYLMRGKCAVKLGNFREGTKALEQALRGGHDYEGTFLLGTAYYHERNYAAACKQFERTSRQQPSNLTCAYNYGQALMNVGDYAKAIPLFEQCKAEDRRFPFAGLHIAKCLHENGNKHEALGKIDQLLVSSLPDKVKSDAKVLRYAIVAQVVSA